MEDNVIQNLPDALKEAHKLASDLGDKLKSISDIPKDVEMISVIMEISNSAYAIALDIEDALETYAELTSEDAEDMGTEEESYNNTDCNNEDELELILDEK